MVIILFTVYTQLLAFSQCSDLSFINISKYAICCRASINFSKYLVFIVYKMVIILFTVYTQLLAFSQCSDLSFINISKYAICCRASINLYLIQHVP